LVLIGRTLKILLGMTTAGQKIFAFIAKICKIIEWCNTVGVEGITAGYKSFMQLVAAVNDMHNKMNKIEEWAKSIGISPEDLIQIILSMQSAGFGGPPPSSPMTEAMWRMLTGIAPVALQAALGAQGRGPQGRIGMGGSKKKRKNRKRKKTLRKQKKTRRKYKKSNKKSKRK
jgi:hypothetical protein